MKTSSKQRKLKYIREKNYYRLGYEGSSFVKVPVDMLESVGFIGSLIQGDMEKTVKDLSKKFKMKFRVVAINKSYVGHDFVNDLTTIKYYFKTI